MMVGTLFSSLIFSGLALASVESVAQEGKLNSALTDGLNAASLGQPLLKQRQSLLESTIPSYRGSADVLIHNAVAVFTEGSIGAGVLLNSKSSKALGLDDLKPNYAGFIVTNFHVVELEADYAVAFAPARGSNLDDSPITKPDILGVLPGKDLALLGVYEIPSYIKGAEIAEFETLRVGADVEAIGHPSNELWSYTRGYISQIRKDYEWKYGDGIELKATLIQTQTPINPGNSGGPLYTRDGRVAGINAFGDQDAQGLNFAISASEFPSLVSTVEESELYRAVALLWNREDIRDTANAIGLGYGADLVRDNGTEILSFSSQDNGVIDLYAVFESGTDKPFFIANSGSGNDVDIAFFLDHNNPNAIFAAYFDSDGDGEYEYQGWDFNGDFIIDHLVQYAE